MEINYKYTPRGNVNFSLTSNSVTLPSHFLSLPFAYMGE